MKREPVQVETRKEINMQKPAKSIFILNSALTTKLFLELAYRDPRCPLQRTSDHREARPLGGANRELLLGDGHF
jgi:hypothetical protein